jgi:hypothetical protein
MASRSGIAALVGVALALAMRAGAQSGARLLRVDGAIASYDIDGGAGFTGEYHVLRAGKHALEFFGAHHGRLTVTLDVGGFGVRVAAASLSDACTDSAQTATEATEVRAWPVDVLTDDRAKGASVLRLGEPSVDRRTRALGPCAPTAWDSLGTWRLNVTSTPLGAAITAGKTPLGTTDAKVVVPYGISARDGREENVRVRIYKPGFIGCTFLLRDLRKDNSNDVSCDLVSPVETTARPARP